MSGYDFFIRRDDDSLAWDDLVELAGRRDDLTVVDEALRWEPSDGVEAMLYWTEADRSALVRMEVVDGDDVRAAAAIAEQLGAHLEGEDGERYG